LRVAKKTRTRRTTTHNFYKKFLNQAPAYFGDLDEADGKLLKYEAVEEGTFAASSMANLSM
jgi:pre-mRNA-splicing factor ISY1